MEQVVRLIRSKGVSVWFITQNPSDLPDSVLGQIGNRVQHALRAYTPNDQKALRSAAKSFRANPAFDTEEALQALGVGEALVSVLDEKGVPTVVEREDIIHAIEAHHNDVEPRTIIACLVQAADAISAARPGARRENLENYIKRLEQLETITGSYPGVDKAYAIQAGREVRVMVKPEQVSEDQMVILARDLAKKIEEEMEYPGQIKVHVLRETKVVEYAK